MNDLISRKALIEWLTSHFDLELDEPLEKEMIRLINDQDAIQPQGIDKDRLIRDLNLNTNYGFYGEFTDGSEIAFTLRELMTIINQQPTTDGWIPVSERLPDMENVLGTTEECEIKMVWYNPNLKKWFGSPIVHIENVIAWQPLPQPYKES